ncbi:acetoacetyl-CoA synthetase [compost metagenome]
MEDVKDSLVLCCETPDGGYFMPLFVSLRDGVELDEALQARINRRLREEGSPRHVPDAIFAVPGVPYTLTSKKMEIPVRRILMGAEVDKVASRDAMANPESIDWYVAFAQRADIRQRLGTTSPGRS